MAVSGAFIDRCKILCKDDWLEGFFWTTWCGMHVSDWSRAIGTYQNVESLSLSTAGKADQLWAAKKCLFFKTCSLVSGLSMVFCWMADVSLIYLGPASIALAALGYAGSAIVSSASVWGAANDLGRGLRLYGEITNPQTQGEEALRQIHNVLRVALFSCLAGWAALSSLHLTFGGEALFNLADQLLYYGCVLFFANLASVIVLPQKKI